VSDVSRKWYRLGFFLDFTARQNLRFLYQIDRSQLLRYVKFCESMTTTWTRRHRPQYLRSVVAQIPPQGQEQEVRQGQIYSDFPETSLEN
jgi:hypothetical protein